jgi:hypothetical protein
VAEARAEAAVAVAAQGRAEETAKQAREAADEASAQAHVMVAEAQVVIVNLFWGGGGLWHGIMRRKLPLKLPLAFIQRLLLFYMISVFFISTLTPLALSQYDGYRPLSIRFR